MRYNNLVYLNGRVTRPYEAKYSKNRNVYVDFVLAVSKGARREDGQSDADFFRIRAMGKVAETLLQYGAEKGRIAVWGHLEMTSAEVNGELRFYTNLIADNIFIADLAERETDSAQAMPYNIPGVDIYKTYRPGKRDDSPFN